MFGSYQLTLTPIVHVSEIGEIAGAAESTIKQTYRLLLPRADELFPPDFNFVVPIEKLMAEK